MKFLISLVLLLSFQFCFADTLKEKHFDPFLQKLTDTNSVELFFLGTASVLVTKPSDDRTRDEWHDHQQMSESDARAGDLLGSGVAGVLIAGGQALFDSDENNYQSHARALVYTTLITWTMKYSFGRQRPNGSDSHQSFPSGHTSTSFATATSLAYAYGWKAAVIAYPIAGFVGLSRLADDAHWASDLVGGAFVGFIVARASSYQWNTIDPKTKTTSKLEFYPDLQPTHWGLVLNYSY